MEKDQRREGCAVVLMIGRIDNKDIVSFFKCALNVRLLSRMTLIRLSEINSNFLIANEEGSLQGAVVDQVK